MRQMFSLKQLLNLIDSEGVEAVKRAIESGEISNVLFEDNDVKALTDDQCEMLKVGDIVAKKTDNQYHCYIVTYKEANQGLCLSYFDASCIETQSYDYTDGHWVYNSEDKTTFADIGGGLPEVTASDNGKVLEVIAGTWGTGRQKVTVLTPEKYSAMTSDEKKNALRGGFFCNGTLAGLTNPVIYPCSTSIYGVIAGMDGNTFTVKQYYSVSLTNWGTLLTINTSYANNHFYLENVGKINNKYIRTLDTTSFFNCYATLDSSKIGAVTSTAVGSMYKNAIAISDDALANAIDVKVKMSNNAVYPAINNPDNDEVVIFSGLDFQTGSLTVTAIYYQ